MTEQNFGEALKAIERLKTDIKVGIVGQTDLVDGLLLAILANGHVLIEGVPGLAKTRAVNILANMTRSEFQRLQFTPDLLPADIIGTRIYNQSTAGFETKKGPIFANFILADEINRAPAKVQSALLESMQEKQVSIGEETHPLPRPFFVFATQNPVEQEGTYPLPEAQLDRFLMKLIVDYPTPEDEIDIVKMVIAETKLPEVKEIIDTKGVEKLQNIARKIHIEDKLIKYITDIVFATRDPERFNPDMEGLIEIGASPRASIALAQISRGESPHGRPPGGHARRYQSRGQKRFTASYYSHLPRRSRRYHPGISDRQNSRKNEGALSVTDKSSDLIHLLKQVRELELVARKNASGFFSGNYETSIRGKGLLFNEARKYVYGESIRQIDWNITSRMNEPYVKTFIDEREREVMIALDVSPSMFTGWQNRTKMEYAIEVAATLAVSAIKARDKLGFLIFSDTVHELHKPARGKGRLFTALKSFLTHGQPPAKPCKESDPRAAFHAIQRFKGKRFVIFVISDFIDHDVPDDLKYIQVKHDVSLLHIYDPLEYERSNKILFAARSPEGPSRVRGISPGETGTLAEMRAFLVQEGEKYNILTASLSTKDPVDRSMMEFFHRKQKRYI